MSDDIADREHPAAKTLAAYLADELPSAADAAIREHVASCDLCTERLLDLQRFLDFVPEPPSAGVADLETAREWRELRERIEKERARSRPRAIPRARRLQGTFGSAPTAYALAAVLAFALIGLSAYTLRLRQELRGPEMNPRLLLLSSLKGVRGVGDSVKDIDLAPHEEARVTFALESPREVSFSRYRVEVKDPGGRLILRSDDLKSHEESFTFTLRTEGLVAGRYSIEVLGLHGKDVPVEVGRYEFRILRR